MSRRPGIPAYRLHKQSGQAIVTLADGLGNRRDVLLGQHNSPESRSAYARVLAEWEASGRRLPQVACAVSSDLTNNELILGYWKFAQEYYRFGPRDGFCLRDALRIVKELYGTVAAKEFGPLALKACRQQMIDKDWCRTYINAQVDRIRRMFRWAAGEELLPATVYEGLKTVEGLHRGRTKVREGKKIKPVCPEHVEASLPHMPATVQAMVNLQQLTGCRPAEVCLIRPIDIDMHNPKCWVYRPGSDQGDHGTHKTAHHEQDRLIFIGPKAQEILRPYLGTKLDAYCFSPATSEQQRNAARRQSRRTPLTPSQRARKPKAKRQRAPRDRYDTISYRRTINRACVKAGIPSWSPNRLRHSRATELRSHGLDLTKTILGHAKVETTQIYAEKDIAAAMDLVSKIG